MEALEAHVVNQDEDDPGLLTRVRDIEQRFKRWDKMWMWITGSSLIGLVGVVAWLKSLGVI